MIKELTRKLDPFPVLIDVAKLIVSSFEPISVSISNSVGFWTSSSDKNLIIFLNPCCTISLGGEISNGFG